MKTLTIQLKERSYPIYIGKGLLSQIQLIESHLKQKHVAIVTNTTVASLYLDQIINLLYKERHPLYLSVANFVVDTKHQKTKIILNKIEALLTS